MTEIPPVRHPYSRRYACDCLRPVCMTDQRPLLPMPAQFVRPFLCKEVRPGWWDVVDQRGERVNAVMMCPHEASKMLQMFQEGQG